MMNHPGIGDESGGGGGELGGVAQQPGSPGHSSVGRGRQGSPTGGDRGPLPNSLLLRTSFGFGFPTW